MINIRTAIPIEEQLFGNYPALLSIPEEGLQKPNIKILNLIL